MEMRSLLPPSPSPAQICSPGLFVNKAYWSDVASEDLLFSILIDQTLSGQV